MSRNCTRRRLIAAGALATTSSLAGCAIGWSDGETADQTDAPNAVPDLPRVDDPPDAVYIPTHREAMVHLPTVEAGEYLLSPMLTYPHPFWLVTGTEREEVVPSDSRGVHLMVTVSDAETGQVLPSDTGSTMRVLRDGDLIDQRTPWPMISQTMGFHFGDNVSLPEDGMYTVEIDLNPIQIRKTGDFEGRFEASVTAEFEFEYDEAFREEVIAGVEYLDEEYWGRRGALEPPNHGDHGGNGGDHGDHGDDDHHDHETGDHHDHSDDGHHDHADDDHHMPFSSLPSAETYPGFDLGEHESDDARFVVRYLEETHLTPDGQGYLLVSPRTPYNRVPLADMALSVEGAITGELEQTLDSELGLHYGIATDTFPDGGIELIVESPPQVSRHTGYETAFLDMSSMSVEPPE